MIVEIAKLVSENKSLKADNEEMREFILNARHSVRCRYRYDLPHKCDCGLTELQEKLRKK